MVRFNSVMLKYNVKDAWDIVDLFEKKFKIKVDFYLSILPTATPPSGKTGFCANVAT